MKDEMFQELVESVKEAGRIRRGEVEASRTFRYDSVDIKQLRNRRGLTQNRFAHIIGVSLATLQGWEQGRRIPQGPAMALLRVFEESPEAVEKAFGINDSGLLSSIKKIELHPNSTPIYSDCGSKFIFLHSWPQKCENVSYNINASECDLNEEEMNSLSPNQGGQQYSSVA